MAPATAVQATRHPKCASAYYAQEAARASDGGQRMSAVVPLAPAVAYLEQLRIELSVSDVSNGGARYAMKVHHKRSKANWRHSCHYDDYRAFQQRLLRVMDQGHFCFAECPWLHAFVKHAFPKPYLFNYTNPRTVEARRLALARFINTLQAVLANPSNHGCMVLTTAIATEFVGFINGDSGAQPSWQPVSPLAHVMEDIGDGYESLTGSFVKASTSSIDTSPPALTRLSSAPLSTYSETEPLDLSERFCCCMCAMAESRSDEQIFTSWQGKASRFKQARASLRSSKSSHSESLRGTQLTNTMLSETESPRYSRMESPDVPSFGRDGTPTGMYPGTPVIFRTATSSTARLPPSEHEFMSLSPTKRSVRSAGKVPPHRSNSLRIRMRSVNALNAVTNVIYRKFAKSPRYVA